MKLQRQLILGYDPDNGVYGDCYRTCIAILLGLDAIEVPHFVEYQIRDGNAARPLEQVVNDWLRPRGYAMATTAWLAEHAYTLEAMRLATFGLPFILTVASPRHKCNHAVIARIVNGQIKVVWCPVACGTVPAEPYWCEENQARLYMGEVIMAIPESLK